MNPQLRPCPLCGSNCRIPAECPKFIEVKPKGAAQTAEELISMEVRHLQRQFESLGTVNDVTASKLMHASFRRVWDAASRSSRSERKQTTNPWKEAIIESCVVSHLSWDETDARKSLANLISWEVQTALDPLVSKSAQELIDKGREQAVPTPLRELAIQARAKTYHMARTTWRAYLAGVRRVCRCNRRANQLL